MQGFPPIRWLGRAAAWAVLMLLVQAAGAVGWGARQESRHQDEQGVGRRSSPEAFKGSPATLAFIHTNWDGLLRSMTDCHSLVDGGGARVPLYLPAEMEIPESVQELEARCGVKATVLPTEIAKLGDLVPENLAVAGLAPGMLYLPHPYVAEAKGLNEMDGWGSYFLILGLIAEEREGIARGMVENFYFEVEHYGAVLELNRTDLLSRSERPLLTAMMRAVYEAPGAFRVTEIKHEWLARGYQLAGKDYETWTRPEHQAGETGLARYWDYGEGPAAELGEGSTYYRDVIRWLIAHPGVNQGFLIRGSELPDAEEIARLRKTSCDLGASTACGRAVAGGFRLTKEFYHGDRAAREAGLVTGLATGLVTGLTTSFRFEAFSGATHHYAPVCLNSLLFRYERDMAHFAQLLGKPADERAWEIRAEKRNAAMQRYLWQPGLGVFADYDFVRVTPSSYADVTSLYPLWAGVATRKQAASIESQLSSYERRGGLAMSRTRMEVQSDMQSGMPGEDSRGVADENWIAVEGLEAYGFKEDAGRIARNFMATVDKGFAREGATGGMYDVGSGEGRMSGERFGRTDGVYLRMLGLISGTAGVEPAEEDSRVKTAIKTLKLWPR